jgi:hypothetical protein
VVEYKAEADELPQGSQASPRWTGAPFISLATQLNEQCVDLVCQLATALPIQELPPFVAQNRDFWRLLERDARQRVAAFPFVIVDLHFNHLEAWQQASEDLFMNFSGSTLYTGVPTRHFEIPLSTLSSFARRSAREDVNVAKAMFAGTADVARVIVLLTLSQIRAIASANSTEVRVRWDSDLELWRDLLVAGRSGEPKPWPRFVDGRNCSSSFNLDRVHSGAAWPGLLRSRGTHPRRSSGTDEVHPLSVS